ncbi:DUF4328 domain-containing protein [Actinokineospora soli]|uniref:DUF4328 domain-containing protein n=1 Tax=Actinokineospora soli TaxID=1048753 RepID=A0ABW2TZ72_9PSEU
MVAGRGRRRGVAFIVWLVRARENAERLCHAEHSLGKGWAIGAWFVPVVNLWFPYKVVRDVWKASKPGAGELRTLRGVPGSPVVALWWGLWVLAIVVDRLGFIGEPETVDDFHTLCVVLTAVAVLKVAAAVVVVRVMAEISGWQERARKDA